MVLGCLILASKYFYGGKKWMEIIRELLALRDAASVVAMRNTYR